MIEAMRDKSRRKVLFVINSLSGGGAERTIATLIRYSEERLDRTEIVLALLDEEEVAYELPPWLRVLRLDCGGSLLRSLLRLRRLVAAERPTVTLSFLTRANVANCIAAFGRAIPWIISERVDTAAHLGTGLGARASRALVRLTYPRASRVIAVSDGVAEGLSTGFGVPPARMEVIANPVDVRRIQARAAEPPEVEVQAPYIMGVGRLVPNKNFALLIEAFAKSGFAGNLLIVGEGPLRAELERLAADLGVADRVKMPGFVANPHALLKRALFYASPSNAEGFPNALVEAMAAGAPALSTNCRSGPAEVLANKRREEVDGVAVVEAGVLTPVGDVEGMVEGFQIMQSSHLRARLTKQALERVEGYSVERAVGRYWAVIDAVAGEPGVA